MTRWLRARQDPPSPDELVARVRAALPDAAFGAADGVLTWEDGPSTATVRTAAGEGGEVLALRRRYSDAALARALVRHYASRGHHLRVDDERDRAAFDAVLDVDDPTTTGYPIVDVMADLLLAEVDRSALPTEPHDRLVAWADALRAAGYERLWAVAYQRVQ